MKLNERGMLIVLSGPSGVGKGTVRRALFEKRGNKLDYSVSMTTRPIRPGEKDGVEYHFVSKEEFERRIKLFRIYDYTSYASRWKRWCWLLFCF